ncbi:MAG: lysyl oxidase family protein [Actinomycetota bacterium]|nr:lysyl oxidase family protein [Actinomycetota bacterium]
MTRRLLSCFGLACAALGLVWAAAAPIAAPGETADLLPDLAQRRPMDLRICNDDGNVDENDCPPDAGEARHLRFTTEALNRGAGPLELEPRAEDCDGNGDPGDDRAGYQRIYQDVDGNGRFRRTVDTSIRSLEEPSGCSHLHVEHNHWHFGDFARYVLLELGPGGAVGEAVAPAGDKISHCVTDSAVRRPNLPGSPKSSFYFGSPLGCGRDDISGISVGWVDRYTWRLEGQSIDITGVPDGDYCLRVKVDPSHRLLESRERNNGRSIKVTLSGNSVDYFPYEPC